MQRVQTGLWTAILLSLLSGVGGCAGGDRQPVAAPLVAPRNPVSLLGVHQPPPRLARLAGHRASCPGGAQLGIDTAPPLTDTAGPSRFRPIDRREVFAIALRQSQVLRDLGGRLITSPQTVPTRYDVAIQQHDPFFGPQAALAKFDSVLSSSLRSENNDRVFNNSTLGGDAQQLSQDLLSLRSGYSKRLLSGGLVTLDRTLGYDSNNRTANLFPSVWESQMELGIRQPLLRGAGRTFNAIAGPNAQPGFNFSNGVVIARMNSQISEADFQQALSQFLSDVEDAYWRLQLAYQAYDSKRQARDVARITWKNVEARFAEGLPGGEADREAQAQAEYLTFELAVNEALQGNGRQPGLYAAERELRFLIGLPREDDRLLRPTETPSTAPVVYDWERLLQHALTHRVEVRRQRIRVRQQELKRLAAKNFLLPQVDLIGRYRLRGLGDDLSGGSGRFASATDELLSFDYQEWEFGVEMRTPVGRRQARAAVQHAELQLARERAILEDQRQAINHRLRNAVAHVAALQRAVQISDQRRQATDRRWLATSARYAADQTTVDRLLDAQTDRLEAQQDYLRTVTDYAIALKNVSRASGEFLPTLGIWLDESTPPRCSPVAR